jgi:hypothetical protein
MNNEMNTNTDSNTDVAYLDQIHGEQPYVFATHLEGYMATVMPQVESNNLKPYVRFGMDANYVPKVNEELEPDGTNL